MKQTALLFCLLGALSLQAQTDLGAFSRAAAEARTRLERALDELDRVQAEVNALRPQLAAKLDDVEGTALRLRAEASNVARLKAGFDVEVSQLNAEKRSVIDNNNYIQSTLLNEYTRRLELTINPAEIPLYASTIRETLAFMESDEDIDDAIVFRQQLKIVELSLARIERLLGGDVFEGPAIVQGTLREGRFALVGPVSYFSDTKEFAGITQGMIQNRANVYVLPTFRAGITALVTTGAGIIPVDTTGGEALEGITHSITLWEEFKLGGFVMIPILGLFVLAIIIAIFKTVELSRVKAAKGQDIEVILGHLRSGQKDAALSHAHAVGGPVGEMLSAAVANSDQDREVMEEVLYEAIIKSQPKLERFLPFIAVVAATAPLLGLLGTVTGMIKTFKLITIVGTGDARNLSSGISEALITTKWGLIVAIPTLIMHALLNRKAKGVVSSMEQAAVSFLNGVAEMRGEQPSGK